MPQDAASTPVNTGWAKGAACAACGSGAPCGMGALPAPTPAPPPVPAPVLACCLGTADLTSIGFCASTWTRPVASTASTVASDANVTKPKPRERLWLAWS
eukprot:363283-Chlamydomonas_euryale.AAC.6